MIDKIVFDTSINPHDDFYNYVNKKWIDSIVLADDVSDLNSFEILREENINKIHEIIKKSPISNIAIIYNNLNLYFSNDKEKLLNILNLFDKAKNLNHIAVIMGILHKLLINHMFTIFSEEDIKNNKYVMLNTVITFSNLPEREYYIDDSFNETRQFYKKHIGDVFNYIYDDNKMEDNDIINLETMMAKVNKSKAEKRDLKKLHSRMKISEFIQNIKHKETDEYFWKTYFKTINIDIESEIVIYDISLFRELNIIINNVSLKDLIKYLKYCIIRDVGPYIDENLKNLFFEMYEKKLNGQKSQKPRWKYTVSFISKYFGDIISKEYCINYFDNKAKDYVSEMVEYLEYEMKLSIMNSNWMTNKTKMNALLKLNNFRKKIGCPNKYKEYNIDLTKFYNQSNFDMILSIMMYSFNTELHNRINKPKDIERWEMLSTDVNAYYNPTLNEIVFPAGILQSPFFDIKMEPCFNFGGIGVIIGHEITHGFDDQGKDYDYTGNINNWWDDESATNFDNISKKLIAQYENYKIQDRKIDGKLTLGENMADLGGLSLAYRAMIRYYKNKNITDNLESEFDYKQKFFIQFSNIWKNKTTDEKQMLKMISDPHSPAKFRVFIVRNLDEFYDAFPVNLDSDILSNDKDKIDEHKMYLSKNNRIQFW